MESCHIRNIALDLILTLITCGFFNLYIQYRQCLAVNDMLGEQKYSFFIWLILCFFTCGIYHIYHEYRMSADIAHCSGKDPGSPGLIAVLLSIFALSPVLDAIQQSEINAYFGNKEL